MKTILDLFSGIGGFSVGMESAGFKTIRFCEIDPDCRTVLKNHWPDVPIAEDIKKLSLPEGFADVVTGGFPCTDLSCAGKQEGLSGERSGLWWEMRRIIGEVRPKFAVMENVPGFLSGNGGAWFGDFLRSLAEIGYDAEWHCITAAAVGCDHVRERLWIVAYPSGLGLDADIFRQISLRISAEKQSKIPKIINDDESGWRMAWDIPECLRVADGLPFELDEIKSRVKMLGNSIGPEIAYLIGREIKNV